MQCRSCAAACMAWRMPDDLRKVSESMSCKQNTTGQASLGARMDQHRNGFLCGAEIRFFLSASPCALVNPGYLHFNRCYPSSSGSRCLQKLHARAHLTWAILLYQTGRCNGISAPAC